MAKHPTHNPEITDEPPCCREAADRAHECLVQLVRLLGRHAAQELLQAYGANLEQTLHKEPPDDA